MSAVYALKGASVFGKGLNPPEGCRPNIYTLDLIGFSYLTCFLEGDLCVPWNSVVLNPF